MPESRLALLIMDHLQQGLILRTAGSTRVDFANRYAYQQGLVAPGAEPIVAAEVDVAVAEQREMQKPICNATAAASRFALGELEWYLRLVAIEDAHELLVCTPQVLRQRDLIRRMQKTYRLTDRQADVLMHMVSGHCPETIARKLGISVTTVYRHQADLRHELRAESNIGIVRLAERLRRS